MGFLNLVLSIIVVWVCGVRFVSIFREKGEI